MRNRNLALLLWFGLSFIAVMIELFRHDLNNYKVFKHVYIHTVQQVNLYIEYPLQYVDVNLYGPFFSMVIAPFALLPDKLGVFFWVMANAAFLFFAISKLPVSKTAQTIILILSAHELMNSSSWLQINPSIAACLILAFCYLNKGKDLWAAFFILFATFIKIYGIVGLAFFFFSKRPLRFIFWMFVWSIVFFVLPMLISSPQFILQSYVDWKNGLMVKAAKNIRLDIQNDYQDISVMGMIRRIFNYPQLNDTIVLGFGLLLFAMQYLRYRYFKDLRYWLYILCSTLIFTVIFSNGSESPTYIIAFPAVCLWYTLQPKNRWATAMMVFAFLLTSFSYSDILTPWFREHVIRPYSLKALPCFVLWIVIVIQILQKQFLKINIQAHQNKTDSNTGKELLSGKIHYHNL